MQYPTPQFIEEEGRIVFFLTFRQFFWLVGGGAACFALFYLLPFWLFGIFAIVIILLVATVAFVKVGGEPASKVFLHFIGFSTSKKNYIWRKKEVGGAEAQLDRAEQSKGDKR